MVSEKTLLERTLKAKKPKANKKNLKLIIFKPEGK